jgi:Fe2+ or Zn2+ uptake regulation protein
MKSLLESAPIFTALSKRTNLTILLVLAEGKPMSLNEIKAGIEKQGVILSYRESVHKALQKLVKTGLVEKLYIGDKGICYRLSKREIRINFLDSSFRTYQVRKVSQNDNGHLKPE